MSLILDLEQKTAEKKIVITYGSTDIVPAKGKLEVKIDGNDPVTKDVVIANPPVTKNYDYSPLCDGLVHKIVVTLTIPATIPAESTSTQIIISCNSSSIQA